MNYRHSIIALLAICLLIGYAVPALADGCIVHPGDIYPPLQGGKFIEPDQRCFIVDYGNGIEALLLQITFGKADLDEFGWLVPLPSPPDDIKPASQAIFDSLYNHTYRYVNYYGGGGGCMGGNGVSPQPLEGDTGGRVDVLEKQVVGDYDVFTVEAQNPDDLKNWIEDNGYVVPDDYESVFQCYINKGWIFMAIKVHLPEEIPWYDGYYGHDMYPIQYGVLHPLAFRFETDELVYPMLISKLNGGGTDLTMYVLADHRMQFKDSKQKWAGWIEEDELDDANPLEYYIKGKKYLTKLRRTYFWDDDYDTDLYLSTAPDDNEDRSAQVELPINYLMLGFLAVGFPFIGRIRKKKE